MAKGKGGKPSVSAGPKLRKKHGPKRHMFRWTGPMKYQFAQAGVLTKYTDYESWVLACQARGKRKDIDKAEFDKFVLLSLEEKKEYFKNIKK